MPLLRRTLFGAVASQRLPNFRVISLQNNQYQVRLLLLLAVLWFVETTALVVSSGTASNFFKSENNLLCCFLPNATGISLNK